MQIFANGIGGTTDKRTIMDKPLNGRCEILHEEIKAALLYTAHNTAQSLTVLE